MGSASKAAIRECHHCGDDVRVYGHRKTSEKVFCDRQCSHDYHNVARECRYCGTEFEVLKSQLERNDRNSARYCSTECMDEWRSEHWVDENNPLHIDSPVECAQCGETFQKRPAKIESHDRHYCSRECHGEWISEHNTGENHPRWQGGHPDYGKEWYAARRDALSRDNHTCQDCARHADELDRQPHVHHITPVRKYDDVSDAHKSSNLITLCQSCHSKWEGLNLKPDNRPI